jgi:hypothetical protein
LDKVVVLYDEAPDPDRYAAHVALCRDVPGATFRHGPVFGTPVGDSKHVYYAEFDFPDRAAFKAGVSSPEFAATGEDAMAMGRRYSVVFASVDDA